MKRLFLLKFVFSVALLLSSLFSYSQVKKMHFYKDKEVACYPFEVGKTSFETFFLAGIMLASNPPYSGIPINGEAALGIILIEINQSGDVIKVKKVELPNPLRSSYSMASFFLPDEDGNFFVPYKLNVGFQNCLPPSVRETFRRALASVSLNSQEILFEERYYNNSGPCENPEIIGGAIYEDSILIVDVEDPFFSSDSPLNFRWFNKDLDELSVASRNYNWLALDVFSNSVLKRGSSILLTGADTRNADIHTLLEVNFQGDSIHSVRLGGDTLEGGEFLFAWENREFLTRASRYISLSNHPNFVIKFNSDLEEEWRTFIPGVPVDAVGLPGGGTLVLHDFNNISLLNDNGDIVANKRYGLKEYDRLENLLMIDDHTFIVTGYRDTGFINATTDNPYAWMFSVFGDINNFEPVSVANGLANGSKLMMFPNPSNSLLTIELQEQLENVKKLIVLNAAGEKVYVKYNLGKYFQIDISWLTSGIYFVNIITESDQFLSGKFIKT